MKLRRMIRLAGVAVGVLTGGAALGACQVAWATTTTLSANSTVVGAGQPVTLNVTVTSPIGLVPAQAPVTFADGTTPLGSATLSAGSASLVVSGLASGVHQITATYNAPAGWSSSTSSPLAVTVRAAGPVYYLAMGDSLGAGTGAPAGQGYVNDIFSHEATRITGLTLDNLSCGGATTGSLLNGGGCTYPQGSQLAAAEALLQSHPGQVAFITIDIGANDISGCVSSSGINATCAQNAFAAAQTNLAQILTRLRAAGSGVPIFGMKYYDPYLAYWTIGQQTAAQQSETMAVTGNGLLASVYSAGSAQVADVETTFDTTNFALTGTYSGQTVPQNVANICAWTHMCAGLNDVHANATGHQLIANTFTPLIDATVTG